MIPDIRSSYNFKDDNKDDEIDDIHDGGMEDQMGGGFNLPSVGPTYGQVWAQVNGNNMLPCEYIAAGDFETAMKILNNTGKFMNKKKL